MKKLLISLVFLTFIAASCNKQTAIVPNVSGASIETPAPVSNLETKVETPTTKSNEVSVKDVVVPKSEEEQDNQIDQNTIKNVEQDSRLDNLDTTIGGLQNSVNIPVQTPAPAPVQVDPSPTPVPTSKTNYFQNNTPTCNVSATSFACQFKRESDDAGSVVNLTVTNSATGQTYTDQDTYSTLPTYRGYLSVGVINLEPATDYTFDISISSPSRYGNDSDFAPTPLHFTTAD